MTLLYCEDAILQKKSFKSFFHKSLQFNLGIKLVQLHVLALDESLAVSFFSIQLRAPVVFMLVRLNSPVKGRVILLILVILQNLRYQS